jgi:hypothetical protein
VYYASPVVGKPEYLPGTTLIQMVFMRLSMEVKVVPGTLAVKVFQNIKISVNKKVFDSIFEWLL